MGLKELIERLESGESVTSVTSDTIPDVTTNAAHNKARTSITSVTSKNYKYWHDYQERAGVLEYDGNLPKEEAEQLAYQSTLVDYCRSLHPEIIAAYEACIYQLIAN